MRRSLLSSLILGAFAVTGSAHAGLVLDLNGAGAGGQIEATALDWAPTSFLAQGGNTAITNFVTSNGTCVDVSCTFDNFLHAKLTAYKPSGSDNFVGIGSSFGEITMVAKFTEVVTDVGVLGGLPSAQFSTTGAGYIEFYWSGTANSSALTGGGFNDGTLIGRLEGIEVGKIGMFTVTSLTGVALDGTSGDDPNDDYPGQLTVSGTGSQEVIGAGTTLVELDANFFKTALAGFSINFENISIGLPYSSVDPSDCFNTTANASAVGTSGQVSTCDDVHQLAAYSGQTNATGYTPVVGVTNGLNSASPDFVAQSDFNSAVTGQVPEPSSVALLGVALGALGFAVSRRRRRG